MLPPIHVNRNVNLWATPKLQEGNDLVPYPNSPHLGHYRQASETFYPNTCTCVGDQLALLSETCLLLPAKNLRPTLGPSLHKGAHGKPFLQVFTQPHLAVGKEQDSGAVPIANMRNLICGETSFNLLSVTANFTHKGRP